MFRLGCPQLAAVTQRRPPTRFKQAIACYLRMPPTRLSVWQDTMTAHCPCLQDLEPKLREILKGVSLSLLLPSM